MPVSAPRRRISWTASRAASVALSDTSIARISFFIRGSGPGSRGITGPNDTGRPRRVSTAPSYTPAVMSESWTPLGSSPRYTRGRLSLREDVWRLPDGREVTYPVLVVGVTVGV